MTKLSRRQSLHLAAGATALTATSRLARAQAYLAMPIFAQAAGRPGGGGGGGGHPSFGGGGGAHPSFGGGGGFHPSFGGGFHPSFGGGSGHFGGGGFHGLPTGGFLNQNFAATPSKSFFNTMGHLRRIEAARNVSASHPIAPKFLHCNNPATDEKVQKFWKLPLWAAPVAVVPMPPARGRGSANRAYPVPRTARERSSERAFIQSVARSA
jgi:hypothetical protein